MGINCDKCVPGYYHPYGVPLNATDSCQGEFSHLFIHIHIVVCRNIHQFLPHTLQSRNNHRTRILWCKRDISE
jgi:hypothetical protein